MTSSQEDCHHEAAAAAGYRLRDARNNNTYYHTIPRLTNHDISLPAIGLWVKCPNVSSFTIKWFNVSIFKENVSHQNVFWRTH